jgi:acyl-CoA dehydrogenase
MNWMIELPIIVTAIGFMMARQASRYLWTGALGAILCYWSILYSPPAWALILTWGMFLPIATFLTVNSLRQNLLISPLLGLYKKIMPSMSDTEREALEAGTVW